jgi:predicted phosphohydrolase
MKVFAISDLHLSINNPKPMDIFGGAWDDYVERIQASWNKNVEKDDVVIIAGDISWAMTLENAFADLDYIGKLSGTKIIIRGNHDYWWKSISSLRKILPFGFYALQNDAIKIGNTIFCGSRGWENDAKTIEDKKIYDRELIRCRLSLDAGQKLRQKGDALIFVTHFPPFYYKQNGSRLSVILEEYKVDKVVYGHLHGKMPQSSLRMTRNGIEYLLTSCDQVGNQLVRVL